jgi:DnaK suppressor protein
MAKKTTAKKTAATKKKASSITKKKAAKKSAVKAKKSVVKKTAEKAATPKKKTAKKKITMSRREKLIQQIKQDLIAQRESLLKEAEDTLNALPSELNFPDMGDQATAETDRNFMLRLRDRERMLLKKIEETIERIDNNEDYGKCEECGNEIGIKRLEARPVTTFCIDCKTRQEEEERIAEGG